jgi:hypothetical protein
MKAGTDGPTPPPWLGTAVHLPPPTWPVEVSNCRDSGYARPRRRDSWLLPARKAWPSLIAAVSRPCTLPPPPDPATALYPRRVPPHHRPHHDLGEVAEGRRHQTRCPQSLPLEDPASARRGVHGRATTAPAFGNRVRPPPSTPTAAAARRR